MINKFGSIIEITLQLLSNEEEEIRRAASVTNELLLKIMTECKDTNIDLKEVIPILKHMLTNDKRLPTSD